MIRCILLFSLLTVVSFNNSLLAQCSRASDSIALRDFYDATQGQFWTNSTGWNNPSAPISTYRGIKLNSSGCVQEIKLVGNNLQGFLPPSVGNMTGLTILDITNNNVGGNLPTQITNLVNLTKLSFDQNNFNGPIPAAIGNLVNLEELLLSQNSLNGSIPTSISACVKLITISLSQNNFFGSIPTSFGQLPRLSTIYIDNNKFAGQIPASLYNLADLREFWAFNNGIVGTLSPALGNWKKIQKLLLNSNKLTGAIPVEIGQLTSMQSFHISDNQLTGTIPTEITNCNMLVSLQMARNQLSGTLPAEIHKMTSLSTLDLTANMISGEIPERIGLIPNLRRVYMADNKLEGCFPQSLKKLCSFVESTNVNTNGYNFRGNVELIHAGDFARWCTGDGWADAKITPVPLICEGTRVELMATGGLTYNWFGPASFASQIANPVIDPFKGTNYGRYFVVVKNQQRCIDTSFIDIKPAGNTLASVNSPICEGQKISLSASGGSAYKWTGPNGFTSDIANPVIENTVPANAGTYTVTINIGNCDVVKTVEVVFTTLGSINTTTPINCVGDTIALNAVLGANQTVTWTGPDNFTSTNISVKIPATTIAKSGKYTGVIKSNTGCQSTKEVEIKVNAKAPLIIEAFEPLCNTTSPIELEIPEGLDKGIWTGQNVKYDGTNYFFDPSGLKGEIALSFSPDPNLCIDNGTSKVFVSTIEIKAIENSPSNNNEDNNGSMIVDIIGDKSNVEFSISGPVNSTLDVTGEQAIINDLPSGDYQVIATSIAGCLDTAIATIRYSKAFFYLPNVVNSQSVVEKSFYVKGRNVLSYDMQIYDRWGNLSYDKKSININDATAGWIPDDTKHLPGVYIYVVTINGIEGAQKTVGSVTVL